MFEARLYNKNTFIPCHVLSVIWTIVSDLCCFFSAFHKFLSPYFVSCFYLTQTLLEMSIKGQLFHPTGDEHLTQYTSKGCKDRNSLKLNSLWQWTFYETLHL